MHRNPRNSFFREVATVLHDTEMEIRVKKIGLHDEKLYRFLFFSCRKKRYGEEYIWLFAIVIRISID